MTEPTRPSPVSTHYTSDDLGGRILAGLRASGKDADAPTVRDLAPVDQLHTGGYPATLDLIGRAGFAATDRVLDVGGGLGGSARVLAASVGCAVTVLDLTAEFCRVGEMLTARTGLSDRVAFRHGDATAMPFADASFDAVWMQHAAMHIVDKERLYAEIARVLRPGGHFATHEPMAGAVQPLHFPVPWATGPEINFLRLPEETRSLLADAGFREVFWAGEAGAALVGLTKQMEAASTAAPPPLGIALVLGPQLPEMLRNVERNLREDRLTVIQGVFERQ